MIPIETVPDVGASLRELGGWGVAVIFAGFLSWVLWAYFRLQSHVLKISTTMSTNNASAVASLKAVEAKIHSLDDVRVICADVKAIETKLDRMNEHLIELKTRGGGR